MDIVANMRQLKISGTAFAKRRAGTIQVSMNQIEKATIAADASNQIRSAGTPKLSSVPGSSARNMAPNASMNNMRMRYF